MEECWGSKMNVEDVLNNKPNGTTAYLIDTGGGVHYLKYEEGKWYSWGKTKPSDRLDTQWNEQITSVIEYFLPIVKFI